jgi:hypothetical protein
MSDTRDLLRRGIGDYEPTEGGLERVLRRRDQKRRNQRLSAMIVAFAILGIGTAVFLRAYGSDEVPAAPPATVGLAGDILGDSQLRGFVVAAPQGWSTTDGITMEGPNADVLEMSVWDVGKVPSDPCHWDQSMHRAGGTVDKVVASIRAQQLRHATEPVDITLAGYEGSYLELHVPTDMIVHGDADFKGCDERANGHTDFVNWIARSGAESYETVPGQVDMLWVIEVDGRPLVVDATYSPDASAEQVRELESVVESIRFR